MAVSGLGVVCRSELHLCPGLVYCVRRVRSFHTPPLLFSSLSVLISSKRYRRRAPNFPLGNSRQFRRHSSAAAVEVLAEPEEIAASGRRDNASVSSSRSSGRVSESRGCPEWRKLSSKELGIKTSMITKATKSVMNVLRKKGHEVYLVGGCVRDLILKKTPKDFDVITTADLKEVLRAFSRCEIVGKRFPICHVHVNDSIVEVSSFSTSARKSYRSPTILRKPPDCSDRDYVRWRNCLARDFTINGLMYDPYSNIVYDYTGGMEDIKKAKVRTVIPADTSFTEDCARILRAVRIAARLGFRFTRETAHSLKDYSFSVLRLDKGRLLMEMNYMLAYGSAEASLRLLWKFGLLEVLLPIQAAYFVSRGFRRRDKRSNMLLVLFSNLDHLLAPDRPCHSSLWVAMLAFHQALVDEPRDPLVIATFSLALHNGGDLSEAVKIARRIRHCHDPTFSELLEPREMDADELEGEVLDLLSSVKSALSLMTDENHVAQAMAKYPQAPYSDLVLISLALYLNVCKIFQCVGDPVRQRGFAPRQSKINYDNLAQGSLTELRHVLARVVFDTVYPLNLDQPSSGDGEKGGQE
ncbi:unnamed protein product [Spirodela intermedia]|uniref:Uncharacterized protein n=2 Tax=Spirodela intermedia TaxID=51605 RepID=A0A7I8L602_SPIIN|nr:unnamed protein product [Spirodela intermedia]CAA6667834.1 unnamed protein product [Spirodela intermedia]CAA7404654.1 unnamed protein product [Spirodela intermedia]